MSVDLDISRYTDLPGYTVVGARKVEWDGRPRWRVEMVDAKTTCLQSTEYGRCLLDIGHDDECDNEVFYCDGCGKNNLGEPFSVHADYDVAFCEECYTNPY